jgi:hypothetical protein
MRRIVLLGCVVALVLASVGLAGCYRKELPANQQIHLGDNDSSGPAQSYTPALPLGSAEELHATVRMGAGEMLLEAGGADALDGIFEYRPSSVKPLVSYEVAGTGTPTGDLLIEQPDFQPNMIGNMKNVWTIRLSKDVPLVLDVELGAGESDLNLSGLDLRELSVGMGVGDTTLDFSGTWSHDVSAQLQAGIGQVTMRLPADVGVRVTARRGGIGSFVADDGFTSDNGVFTNTAFGKTASTIDITVQRGIGEVRLETVR